MDLTPSTCIMSFCRNAGKGQCLRVAAVMHILFQIARENQVDDDDEISDELGLWRPPLTLSISMQLIFLEDQYGMCEE